MVKAKLRGECMALHDFSSCKRLRDSQAFLAITRFVCGTSIEGYLAFAHVGSGFFDGGLRNPNFTSEDIGSSDLRVV